MTTLSVRVQVEYKEMPAAVNGSLSDASVDRLVCLLRHWTSAEEAMVRFDQELSEELGGQIAAVLNVSPSSGER